MASQFADGPTPLPVNLTEEEKVTPPDDDPVPSSSGVTAKEEAAATATTATGQEAAAAGELQTNGASAEAEETSKEGAKNSNTNNGDDDGNNAAATAAASFECNICLDVARDAVISMCGHLFCWPCLHTWLETRPHRQICPVCKAGIGRDKVVPIYGRSDSNPKDPRDKPLPPRPRGQRPEPETVGGIGSGGGFAGLAGGGAGGGSMFQMSFGIGAFPFGLFTTNINMGGGGGEHPFGAAARMTTNQEPSVQLEEEQFLHKAFLWVAFAFIFWLLIA